MYELNEMWQNANFRNEVKCNFEKATWRNEIVAFIFSVLYCIRSLYITENNLIAYPFGQSKYLLLLWKHFMKVHGPV